MTIFTAIIIPARAPISMPDPCEVASDDAAIVLVGVISAVSVMGVVGSGTCSGASKQTERWIDEWDWAGRQAGRQAGEYMNRWTDRRTNG